MEDSYISHDEFGVFRTKKLDSGKLLVSVRDISKNLQINYRRILKNVDYEDIYIGDSDVGKFVSLNGVRCIINNRAPFNARGVEENYRYKRRDLYNRFLIWLDSVCSEDLNDKMSIFDKIKLLIRKFIVN